MIVFLDDRIVYVENPKEFINKFKLTEFNKVFGYKTSILKNSFISLCYMLAMNMWTPKLVVKYHL